MMSQRNKELKLILVILTVITVLSVVLATGFAVLYLSVLRDGDTVGTGVGVESTSDTDTDSDIPDLYWENRISVLEKEKEVLQKEADALAAALEQMKESSEAVVTEHLPPTDDTPIVGTFDPGNLTPADPASLAYTFDLTSQLARIRALEEKMYRGPFIVDPDGELIKVEDIEFDEDTEILYRAKETSPLDEDGRPTETEIDYEAMGYRYPTVSVSYRDLERGTTYAYGGDTVYFSASLIKAPYIYTLLYQIAQYNEIKAANPDNDPQVGDTLSEEIWEKYDLARKITVTKAMIANGSGKIKDMELPPEGKEFTVLELIEYAIKVSDNTAFRVLRDEFGYDYFWAVSRKLGIKSVFESFNKMTANEACIYLAAIYDFAKEYPTEGGMLIALMKKANHQVLIPMAVKNPYNAAHKYGWDSASYHDMAIVYGDAPFAVCIMTDFDFSVNDDDINAYMREIIAEIEEIHLDFYDVSHIPEQKK